MKCRQALHRCTQFLVARLMVKICCSAQPGANFPQGTCVRNEGVSFASLNRDRQNLHSPLTSELKHGVDQGKSLVRRVLRRPPPNNKFAFGCRNPPKLGSAKSSCPTQRFNPQRLKWCRVEGQQINEVILHAVTPKYWAQYHRIHFRGQSKCEK